MAYVVEQGLGLKEKNISEGRKTYNHSIFMIKRIAYNEPEEPKERKIPYNKVSWWRYNRAGVL